MPTILIVDDSASDRDLAESLLSDSGLYLLQAGNGQEALEMIERSRPDLVLTDLHMPEIDGLELVQEARILYPRMPVILMTAFGTEELALQALRAGAASFVPKRNLANDLLETVQNVLASAEVVRDQDRVLECLVRSECEFVLDNDEKLITPLFTYLEADLRRHRLCSDNELIRVGVSLREALINAMHHGNLEVGSDFRQQEPHAYSLFVEQRRKQKPYSERRVQVLAKITPTAATYIIADEGPGFDLSHLPDPTDFTNFEKPSGRGLLLIRTFMDEVSYNESGNTISMVKRRKSTS